MQTLPNVEVLIVDDRTENLLALEAILQPLKVAVRRASSGEEALKLVLKHEFAVILLDVQMPGIDGFETAKLIRSRAASRHIPIIFLTALERDPEEIGKGYGLGAVDYLLKPISPQIVRWKVAAFAELHQKSLQAQELVREQAARAESEAAACRFALRAINNARLYEEARRANQAKDEFLAVVSHELRTPLTVILGWVHLLSSGKLGAEQSKSAIRTIENSARLQELLISDLLDVSRITSGQLAIERKEISINEVIHETVE